MGGGCLGSDLSVLFIDFEFFARSFCVQRDGDGESLKIIFFSVCTTWMVCHSTDSYYIHRSPTKFTYLQYKHKRLIGVVGEMDSAKSNPSPIKCSLSFHHEHMYHVTIKVRNRSGLTWTEEPDFIQVKFRFNLIEPEPETHHFRLA